MSPKPTLVFVPGAWHGPETWSKLTTRLEAQQYSCVSVELPTTRSDPDATFSDDVKAVRKAIQAETIQGRDVVVVVHSYGGAVGPSAIRGLARPKQAESSSSETDSSSGHVIGIVLIATGFMPTGVGFLEAMGGTPPPIWKLDEERGLAVITVDPRELFYHDLPKEEGDFWVSKLRDQSLKAFTDGTDAYAGWMDVPVWYLMTLEDRSLSVEAQKISAQMARDGGANVTTAELATGHSPMLSSPEKVIGFILEALESLAP